jgi:copper chaperone CopZ
MTSSGDSLLPDSASRQTTLQITGMTCPACVRRVDKALRAVPGVREVAVDLATGRATIDHAAEADELAAAATRAGYAATVTETATGGAE